MSTQYPRSLLPAGTAPVQPPVPADYYRSGYAYDPEPPEEPAVPLSHYLWILRRHRWKILSFIFATVAATLVISSRITPIYESTTTVDVDRQTPAGVIGQEATRTVLNDADQFLATQVKLIQSDSVLRPVARQYNLRDLEKDAITPEKAAAAQDAPVLLKNLKVTRPPNTYLLLISYRSPDPRLASDVSNAIARSYLEHTYTIRFKSSADLSLFMEKQLEELKAKMERSGAALAQFEKDLSVINPEEKTSILSARLVQLNADRTKAETDRITKEAAWRSVQGGTLEAAQVSTQGESLKKISERLDEAEQKFADVKTHYGANHPEYKKAAAQLNELQRQFQNTRESIVRRVEVEYHEALNREFMLKKSVAETKAEFDHLNARSFEYQSLKREAEADKKLYDELVRKIKESGINANFQNSNIRIADNARPALKPVFPNLKLNLLLAFLFSTLLSVGAAVLSDVLDNSVRDPDQIKSLLNMEVLGSLPMVKNWRNKLVSAIVDSEGIESVTEPRPSGSGILKLSQVPESTPTPDTEPRPLGSGGPESPLLPEPTSRSQIPAPKSRKKRPPSVTGFEEAVRTLRNSILLTSFDRQLKSLMVTSAGPSEGKTTTSVHLALAHAQQKHKTLLIDGDLRRPGVHRKFGLSPDSGLATVLQNGLHWQEKLITLDSVPDLDILPVGHSNRRAADLIGASLPKILEEASRKYDLIVIDAPPVLGFPEPLQMAAAVDGVVLVAKAGETNRKAMTSAVGTLQRLRANVVGLVLNEVTKEMSDGYHYYGYYGKYYRYYRPSE